MGDRHVFVSYCRENRRQVNELHDGLGQSMAALRFRVRQWHKLVDSDPAQMHVELDELGSFVVDLIDGKRNVLEIVEAFQEKYKTNRRETQVSVVTFLKTLAVRGVASVVIP